MSLLLKKMNYFIHTRDIDLQDVMKPAAVLDIFQDVAGLHAEEMGIGYQRFKELNYAWIVLYQEFEILDIPPYLYDVDVLTWPKERQRLEFERELLIQTKEGKPLIKGIADWAIVDIDSHRLARAKEIAFEGEFYPFTNYKEKCPRRLNLDESLIKDEFIYSVQYDDIDHNGHMNNARYLTMIFNHYPFYKTKKYVYMVKIAYIMEAKYQNEIRIGHFSMADKEAYIGYINEEKCFECVIGVKEK